MTFVFLYYLFGLALTLSLSTSTLPPTFERMRFYNYTVGFYIDLLFLCMLDNLINFLREVTFAPGVYHIFQLCFYISFVVFALGIASPQGFCFGKIKTIVNTMQIVEFTGSDR